MYGFCRDGLSPRPSAGATWVTNGLAGTTSRTRKKPVISASTMIIHGCSSPSTLRVLRTPSRLQAERMVAQRSSEPACEPHHAVTR